MKKTNIEEIADKLRIAWNEATHQVGTRWECLSERSRRGYIAVAKAAVECAGEKEQYRDLTHDDTIQPGDEVWAFGAGPWEPVSESEHGQQYRNGYNRMRRLVADSTISAAEHSELAKWEEACRAKDRDIDKLHKKLERIEKATMCLRGFREINSHDPAQCIIDAATMIQKLQRRVRQLEDEKPTGDFQKAWTIASRSVSELTERCEQLQTEIADKDTTIRRLREKLENLEYYVEHEHVAAWRQVLEALGGVRAIGNKSLVDAVINVINERNIPA